MALTTRSDVHRKQGPPRAALLALTALVALFLAAPAQAAFHLVVIQEVFVGTPSDGIVRTVPLTADQKAQYVMLRMTSAGQTVLTGTSIRVEAANGAVLGTFGTFTANVGNGGAACGYPSCPAFIIGTQAAKNLFTFTFDKIVDGQAGRVALPAAGGRVCFVSGNQVVDCLAWGNFNCPGGTCATSNGLRTGDFTANGCDTNFGTPAPALTYGSVLEHGATFNCAAKANSTEYTKIFPKPGNNAGSTNNADSDADGLIDQLDCNDATGTLLWPVTEVQNDHPVFGNPSMVVWDSQAATAGTGIIYDIAKGRASFDPPFTGASCLALHQSGASVNDAALPPAGDAFYYVVRAEGCNSGTWGSGFAPATSRDPILDPLCP